MSIGGLPGDPKCPDCKSTRLVVSAVPGMASCQQCGKLSPIPTDVIELLYGEDQEPEETVEELIKVPDAIECFSGWRSWGVKVKREKGTVPLLHSATHREAFWVPGQPMRAVCDRWPDRNLHEVPDEGCSCGLYSAKTYDHLMTMSYHRYNAEKNGMYSVVGKVKLWGKVIEGTQGWRAEFGYPEELFVPFEAWDLLEPLEQAYKVPVGLKNILGAKLQKKKTTEGGAT